MSTPAQRLAEAIRTVRRERVAMVAFLTAGFPSKDRFAADLTALAAEADVVEIGVPFTDPMADGITIQRSSLAALAQGVSLQWILDTVKSLPKLKAQLVFMGYLNPMLAYGLPKLAADAAAAGISGFIVPDLPIEESAEFEQALAPHGLALIRMVTPVTPQARLERLARDAQGFVYAVSMTGTTGRAAGVLPRDTLEYLDRVRKLASVPVCAGFGIREHAQVAALAPHVDGVVVGSAVIEAMEKGASTAELLRRLRVKLKVANARGAPTLGITLLLGSLSMISPLSIDTFLPSLPAIAREFQISSWQAQQIITAYLLPFAVFSLVHGSLSDALGRRTVVLCGLALYTAGSVGCLLAPNLGLLLFCRVLQGMAAGVGSTVARAVVRDLFEGANAQKLMSSMMLIFSLAPAVAPIIGGWLHVTWGWRSVFGLLLTIGVIQMFVCGFLLPESHPPSKRIAFHPVSLLRSCWQVASGRAFLLLAFSAALSIAPLFAYIGSAPAIILERWHLKETQFYYVFIPVVAGFMMASVLGSHMAGRVPRPRQIALGLGLMLFSAIAGLVAHGLSDQVPILLTQLLLFCVALGVQLSNPILSLAMLDMHPLARGAAASVQAFISLGIGGVMMGMVAPMLRGDLGLLAGISLVAYTLAWLAWRAGQALERDQRAKP